MISSILGTVAACAMSVSAFFPSVKKNAFSPVSGLEVSGKLTTTFVSQSLDSGKNYRFVGNTEGDYDNADNVTGSTTGIDSLMASYLEGNISGYPFSFALGVSNPSKFIKYYVAVSPLVFGDFDLEVTFGTSVAEVTQNANNSFGPRVLTTTSDQGKTIGNKSKLGTDVDWINNVGFFPATEIDTIDIYNGGVGSAWLYGYSLLSSAIATIPSFSLTLNYRYVYFSDLASGVATDFGFKSENNVGVGLLDGVSGVISGVSNWFSTALAGFGPVIFDSANNTLTVVGWISAIIVGCSLVGFAIKFIVGLLRKIK